MGLNWVKWLKARFGSRWDAGGDLGTDIASIIASLGGVGSTQLQLYFYGVVTAVPGANQFTIPALAGLGAGKFSDATQPYWAFVLRDGGGAGAAPQGEMQAITGYVTATGVFTTGAFTAAVAANDEILILHPALARVLTVYANLNTLGGWVGYEGATPLADKLTAARSAYLDKIVANYHLFTAWSSKSDMVPSLAFSNVAADKALPSVVVPANFLPAGCTIVAVYLVVKWRKMVESSGAPNAINAASKTINTKIAAGAWGVNDLAAITLANGAWSMAANATEPGDVLIGTVDLKGIITGDNVTVNVASRTDGIGGNTAITVTGASLTLYDVETAILYKVHL